MRLYKFLTLCVIAAVCGCTDAFKANTPEVKTLEAAEITYCSAYLAGEWNSEGLVFNKDYTKVNYFFYVSDTPSFSEEDRVVPYGNLIHLNHNPSGNGYHTLYDLTPNTTYYYVFALSDGFAEVRGEVKSFTTERETPVTANLYIDNRDDSFVFIGYVTGLKERGTLYIQFCDENEEIVYSDSVASNWEEPLDNLEFEHAIQYSVIPYSGNRCRLVYETWGYELIILTGYQEVSMPEQPETILYKTNSKLFLYNLETESYNDGEMFELFIEYNPAESVLNTQSVEGWFDVRFFSDNNMMWCFDDTETHSFDYSFTREVPDFTAEDEGSWNWIQVEDYYQSSGTLYIRNNKNNHYLQISPGDIVRQ